MSSSPLLPPREAREENIIYFYGDSDIRSWAAPLDPNLCELMTEEQIAEFVKLGRPDVFKTLQGLPFSSSDIPSSHNIRHMTRSASEPILTANSVEAYPSRDTRLGTLQDDGVQKLADVHFKKNILLKLFDDHVLMVRQMSPGSAPIPCQTPFCARRHVVPRDKHYLQLLDLAASEHNSEGHLGQEPEVFCLKCLEEGFDCAVLSLDNASVSSKSGPTLLDGVDHATIISSAERLYPTFDHISQQPNSGLCSSPYPKSTDERCSVSTSALQKRVSKQIETGITLAEVAKYEKAMLSARDTATPTRSTSPSLLITRMPYQEPEQERYKKQGLRKYDRIKYTKEQKQELSIKKKFPPVYMDPPSPLRYCYCRDYDDGTELIRCSSDLCPVGWFHLRCSGLERVPTINQTFFCRYCSNDFGLFNNTERTQARHLTSNDVETSPGDIESRARRLTVTDSGKEEWEETEDSEDSEITATTDAENEDEDGDMPNFLVCSAEPDSQLVEAQTTLFPKVGTWGVSINNRASSPAELRPQNTDQISRESAEHMSMLQSIDPMTLDGMDISSQQEYVHRGCEVSKLPNLDYANLKFYDLAPFMFAEGLSTAKKELFQAWKNTRPKSRLLVLQNGGLGDDQAWEMEVDLGQVEREALSIKLGEVFGDYV